jgi:hypothetical protein
MRVMIDDVVTSYTKRVHSHKSSWPRMQACMVQDVVGQDECAVAFDEADISQAATWMVSHSMEFDGEMYNLFGGWGPVVHGRISRLLGFPGQLQSLERPMPDLQQILLTRQVKAREKDQSAPAFTAAEWNEISRRCAEARVVTHQELLTWAGRSPSADVVVGDSHAVAHYRRGRMVYRHDGLTLHGLLDRLHDLIEPLLPITHLTIVAGNIDLRHHVGRHGPPHAHIFGLLERLRMVVDQLIVAGAVQTVTVSELYPVEHEGRRIPQTGFYKGTAFHLPQAERAELVQVWNTRLRELLPSNTFWWPPKWYEMAPEKYAECYMEKPGSVHLSPYFHQWDYWSNQPNERLRAEYA